MITAREAALKALASYRRSGSWSALFLKNLIEKEELDKRDASLAANICTGVLQNMYLCDFYISCYSSVKPEKMEPMVLDILRLSVYQIVFLDKIPHSAAVNEGVALCKKYSNKRAAGLVNAVLRKISAQAKDLPQPQTGNERNDLSVKYSHPVGLVDTLTDLLGREECEEFLKLDNTPPDLFIQVNTIISSTQEVLNDLLNAGCSAAAHPWLPDCIVVKNSGNTEKIAGFSEGRFYVQDPAAKLSVIAAAPKTGDLCIDGCAAPGGKSFAAAISMHGKGRIISCDIHANKLGLIVSGAKRLKIDIIETLENDSRKPLDGFNEQADVVIADVPCSGIGVIRKKPEIRYKDQQSIAGLPQIQLDILSNLSGYVKHGGTLLYSTCTVLKRENEDVVKAFTANHPDFFFEPFELPGIGHVDNGMITLWPQRNDTDGFFICKMKRK